MGKVVAKVAAFTASLESLAPQPSCLSAPVCLLQAAFPECPCPRPLAQSGFLALSMAAVESTLCNDWPMICLSCHTGLHDRDLKRPRLNSRSTCSPYPQTTVFPVSVKVTSILPVSWAKHQGVDLHFLLSPPTSHPPANPVGCAFEVHLESDHFSHPHVTTLIESTIISHLDSFRQPLPDLPLSLPSSVVQSCPTLCNPMDRSTPGLPVHHQLPEFTQTHVH